MREGEERGGLWFRKRGDARGIFEMMMLIPSIHFIYLFCFFHFFGGREGGGEGLFKGREGKQNRPVTKWMKRCKF